MNQFLTAIQPQLTFYGVLLTLIILFFRVGLRLWRHEGDTAKEQTEHLKQMMIGFRRAHVEPILQEHLSQAIKDAYEQGRDSLSSEAGADTRPAPPTVVPAYDDAIQDFLASKSGEDFLDKVDARYRGQRDILTSYHSMTAACLIAAYGFIAAACLLAVGFIKILYSWSDVVTVVWLLTCAEVVVFAVIAVIRFEAHRRLLSRRWENFEIYGQI